jgi:light-regulated signal transduction histidine kinase (bacteriophytochrome)
VQLKPVNLNETIDAVIADMKKQWQHKAHEIEITSFPVLNSDPILMQQIFTNLVSNAFKYSSRNEVIKVQISSADNGDHYLFKVADNGVGFDMAYHDKVFKAFTRLHHDAEFEGTGLGLNSVKRFVEKLGGRIWAESALGQGSTFYFTIPLREIRQES